MQLDFSSGRPIFLQVAERIEDAIVSGAFGEERQVPSITEFSVGCKINPATALKGINLLVDAGVLYKKRGVGMFVAAGAQKKLLEKRRQAFFAGHVAPLVDEARRLDISQNEVGQMVQDAFSDKTQTRDDRKD